MESEIVTCFYEDWNEPRAHILLTVFVDNLFSREVKFLKRKRVVKYLKNLRVLILEFYPYFSWTLNRQTKIFLRIKRFISVNDVPDLYIGDNAKCFTRQELNDCLPTLPTSWRDILEVLGRLLRANGSCYLLREVY